MRRRLFKDIHPVAHHTPILPGGPQMRLTLDQNQNDLAVAGHLGH